MKGSPLEVGMWFARRHSSHRLVFGESAFTIIAVTYWPVFRSYVPDTNNCESGPTGYGPSLILQVVALGPTVRPTLTWLE